ncbi:MAG: sugar nucleotide-binding protein [Candidatus Omnitrophica bacterium]|nr:sugar nucleotide-binding protein [Candidatus Omnitrophota bacterium]MDD5236206.1 sugar nucleotide-binding protein [Candidatus Omnitrophota bacterium]MDD5610163.1 sugar nucleotide-binding protein [Candidatus Omnitrophota bacterium]
MRNDILVLGKGFIGSRIQKEFDCAATDKMITSFNDAESEIKKFNPKMIINCIGYIGKNVDECELNKDTTLTANTFIPIILAEVALRNNIRLVHISSGCIYHYDYDKDPPLAEDREPDFFELFYSRTKIYSEKALEILAKKYPILIARIRVPLDDVPGPRNILNKLISYRNNIIDIPNSITYIPDFVRALKHLVDIKATGIYNLANKGGLRYPELLDVYKKYVPDFQYKVIDYKKLNIVRTNLILSVKKLQDSGFKVRDIHEVLEECVKNYLKY